MFISLNRFGINSVLKPHLFRFKPRLFILQAWQTETVKCIAVKKFRRLWKKRALTLLTRGIISVPMIIRFFAAGENREPALHYPPLRVGSRSGEPKMSGSNGRRVNVK